MSTESMHKGTVLAEARE